MDPWIVPTINAAGVVIKNRQQIAKVWDLIAARTGRRGFSIAVIGEAGVGKSVLMDHLTGDAFSQNYEPPGQSGRIEKDSVRRNKHRYKFTVVPGQPIHRDRINDLEESLTGRSAVDGVIYVTANGYHELRTTLASDLAVQLNIDNIDELRQNRLNAEIDDFRDTLKILRRSINERKQPTWMIIAANKADLYSAPAELKAAQTTYVGGGSLFHEAMDEFLAQVGSDNFAWTAKPVCGWLEPFTFRSEVAPTTLTPMQRNVMLRDFLETVRLLSQGKK